VKLFDVKKLKNFSNTSATCGACVRPKRLEICSWLKETKISASQIFQNRKFATEEMMFILFVARVCCWSPASEHGRAGERGISIGGGQRHSGCLCSVAQALTSFGKCSNRTNRKMVPRVESFSQEKGCAELLNEWFAKLTWIKLLRSFPWNRDTVLEWWRCFIKKFAEIGFLAKCKN
jgi:hypothetical protein